MPIEEGQEGEDNDEIFKEEGEDANIHLDQNQLIQRHPSQRILEPQKDIKEAQQNKEGNAQGIVKENPIP